MTAPLTAWFDHGTGNAGDEARGTRAAPRKRRDAARAPTTSRSSAGHWTRPARPRPGRRVPARTNGAGGAKKTIEPLTRRRASCSVGVHPARPHTADPRTPSPRPPGHPRTTPTATPGTGRTPPRPADPPDLTAWPQGMRANRAPRAAPPGRPAALRGHRRSHRPTALATNTKEASSQASKSATGHEPAAREPHPPHKRHPARPRPFAEPRAEPHLTPDHGPGPQTCRPSPRRRPWPTPLPAPGSPGRSTCD